MALWYYGWEFTQTDPTFPSYVLSSVQWIHPSLSRFIPENKLLASVPCFQKIRLLFTNDLYFLTITCRPSRSFFLFPLSAVTYLAEILSGLKIFCSLSFIDRELLCFPLIFPFFLLPSDLRSGILLFFLFYCSFFFLFFSFLPFLPTSSFPFFGKSGFSILFALPWGDSTVLCFSGKNEGSFFTGQGSKRSKVVFQWGLLSREPNLDIWGETNLGVKVSISGRASILFHKARVTMMIWKQRAKLVMATARWALKHPVYGIVILRLGIHTDRPNVSKLCSFISSMNSSTLISVHSGK